MTLYFITGNKNKFAEAQKIFPEIQMLDLDLPEIQEVNGEEIIKAKLNEAMYREVPPEKRTRERGDKESRA